MRLQILKNQVFSRLYFPQNSPKFGLDFFNKLTNFEFSLEVSPHLIYYFNSENNAIRPHGPECIE